MSSAAPNLKPGANPIPVRTADTPTKVYTGGCHCGKFEFECRHPILEDGFEVLSCNCSICTQRGYLLMYILNPAEDFKLLKGTPAELTTYKFNRHIATHHFCPHCGSAIFIKVDSALGKFTSVNVRTIKNLEIELEQLTLKGFNGRMM